MKLICTLGAALLLQLAPFHIVSAATRVLVGFDQSGHTLKHIVQVPEQQFSGAIFAHARTLNGRQAIITWFDSAGNKLAVSSHPDPRVTHAPLLNNQQQPQWVVIPMGAYLLTGPDNAVSVSIELQSWQNPSLSAENWQLEWPL